MALSHTVTAKADQISRSVCQVTKLSPLSKPVEDLLGWGEVEFDCQSPIGLSLPANLVFVHVSEHDYANIDQLYKSKASVNYSFNGTYAGFLDSYAGRKADNSILPVARTGIIVNGNQTTFIFEDVLRSNKKSILNAFNEVGAVNLIGEHASVELSKLSNGLGQLKLTVLTTDIEEKILAVAGNISLSNGKQLASDQIQIQNESAFEISNLMIRAGFAVDQGSGRSKHSGYSSFWDYVYLDKDGKVPLFHCANVHSGVQYTKCYISQLRLK